jgi:Rv0078B-related antitoxin
MARVFAAKSGMERLRIAHEIWELTRDRLTAFLRSHHPEWDEAELQSRVADWLLHGSMAAFVAPHPALSPEGRGLKNAEGRG